MNLSKEWDKKLTFKLFKIKIPRGIEQKRISAQRKIIESIMLLMKVYKYQYIDVFILHYVFTLRSRVPLVRNG